MSLIPFYKDGTSWVLNDIEGLSSGNYAKKTNSEGVISIYLASKVFEYMPECECIAKGLYSDFCDANGNAYTSLIAFKAATDGFFVKASSGGGAISLPISQSDVSGLADSLAAKIDTSKLGAAEGVATLGADKKIKPEQINLTGAEILSVTNQAARLALASADHFRIVLQGDTNWLWAINKDLAPATAGNWVDCGSAGSAIVKVNTKTGPEVTLAASDVGALALSSILAKGDILVGTGNGAVARVVAGLDGQVLGYDSTQNTGLKPISVAAATGVQASYMRASAGGSQLCSSGNIITLSPVISAGSDITCASNCFLLKANRTYALRGSLGGVNFTTTGNSYMYAQWRVGQTGGSGALLGNAANVEASAQSSQNQRCVYIAEAEYTPTADTWVHFEVTSVGTNVNIGCGPGAAASVWIEVIAGNAPVTGQSVEYMYANSSVSQSYSNNADITFSTFNGNVYRSGNTFTLLAGITYELSCGIRQIANGSAFDYSWYNNTAGAAIGNYGSANSNAAMGDVSAEAIITPMANISVSVKMLGAGGSGTAGARFCTIRQLGTSSVIDMIGATATTPGVKGTVPAPAAGKHNSLFKGDGTFTSGLTETPAGFTKMGSDAPAIKVKKLTGTTAAAEGGAVTVAHGLTYTKILAVQGLIDIGSSKFVPFGYTANDEFNVNLVVGSTVIEVINHALSSGSVLSKPYKILVTYEE